MSDNDERKHERIMISQPEILQHATRDRISFCALGTFQSIRLTLGLGTKSHFLNTRSWWKVDQACPLNARVMAAEREGELDGALLEVGLYPG